MIVIETEERRRRGLDSRLKSSKLGRLSFVRETARFTTASAMLNELAGQDGLTALNRAYRR